MRKILVIAVREFSAAVRTKAFLISLILMPLLMFGGMLVQRAAGRLGDIKPKRIAVIDRTPGAELYQVLEQAAEKRNEKIFDATGRQTGPRIFFERVEPVQPWTSAAANRQRLELSERVRQDEIFAFVEIGRDMLAPRLQASEQSAQSVTRAATRAADMSLTDREKLADDILGQNNRVDYATNRPTNFEVRTFLEVTLAPAIYQRRLANAGLPYEQVVPLITPVRMSSAPLWKLTAEGEIEQGTRESQLASFFVPMILIILMFLIVMVGASPLTTNLVEEKQLKISEVLLGSVSPFQLMMGKLIGGVGVALTLGVIYIVGAYIAARQFQGVVVQDLVSPGIIAWFVLFTIIGTMMYGAMFVAAGAAVTNVKEAQTMITPVILLIVLPIFVLQNLLTDPNGTLARIGSFFPTSAPMVTVARLSIPPGIPLWETLASALVAIITTIAIVWAAGRIFRVGILMQGQGAKLGQMLRWIVRG